MTVSLATRRILDVENMLGAIRYLNEAVFMAAGSLSEGDQMNAIQAVTDEINNKLRIVEDRLAEVRETLK